MIGDLRHLCAKILQGRNRIRGDTQLSEAQATNNEQCPSKGLFLGHTLKVESPQVIEPQSSTLGVSRVAAEEEMLAGWRIINKLVGESRARFDIFHLFPVCLVSVFVAVDAFPAAAMEGVRPKTVLDCFCGRFAISH